jgi:hypothetical protein
MEDFVGKIFNLNDSTQIRVREMFTGRFKIQLWKWVKWAQDGEFHPTRVGFMIEKDQLKRDILPYLIKLTES